MPIAIAKVTKKEMQGLEGVFYSDFHDGNEKVDNPVWTWSANTFMTRRTFSGVVSSLVKKGLVLTGEHEPGNPEYNTIALTQAGMDVILNAAAERAQNELVKEGKIKPV